MVWIQDRVLLWLILHRRFCLELNCRVLMLLIPKIFVCRKPAWALNQLCYYFPVLFLEQHTPPDAHVEPSFNRKRGEHGNNRVRNKNKRRLAHTIIWQNRKNGKHRYPHLQKLIIVSMFIYHLDISNMKLLMIWQD